MQIREVSKEQWVDWKHHPVTKVFLETVRDQMIEIQETAMQYGSDIDVLRGNHEMLKEILLIEREENFQDDQD